MADHRRPRPRPPLLHACGSGAIFAGLKGEELVAWRLADVPDRPSADERNLPDEFPFGWFAVHYSDKLAPAR
ncbi:hypothetical protein AB5I41_14500 [Sphingomonas sp. MMS24-JH45]